MSVEFRPKNKECICFGIANQTWFQLLADTKVGEILGREYANDPLDVSTEEAEKVLKIMKEETFSVSWNEVKGTNKRLIDVFIEFLECCNGFTTH